MMKKIVAGVVLALVLPFEMLSASEPFLEIGPIRVFPAEYAADLYRARQADSSLSESRFAPRYLACQLKRAEAARLRVDTTAVYRRLRDAFRYRLAVRYLAELPYEEALREAYDRLRENERLSQILFPLAVDPRPVDTLRAYADAVRVRETLLRGLDFDQAVAIYSEDPAGNRYGGEMAADDPLRTDSVFASIVSRTPVDGVTPLIRTASGYRLVKVLERSNVADRIRSAHILVAVTPSAPADRQEQARLRIESLYDRLAAGADFETLAREASDDPLSAPGGGLLPELAADELDPQYRGALGAMKPGDPFSRPFRTAYGWHIVRLVSLKACPDFPEMRAALLRRLNGPGFTPFAGLSASGIEARIDSLEQASVSFAAEAARFEAQLAARLAADRQPELSQAPSSEMLQRYFREHRKRYGNRPERFGGIVVGCRDKRTARAVKKALKRLTPEQWESELTARFNRAGQSDIVCFFGLFDRGQNPWVDRAVFGDKTDTAPFSRLVRQGKRQSAEPREYEEVASQVYADWLLEQESAWVERVLPTYPHRLPPVLLKNR